MLTKLKEYWQDFRNSTLFGVMFSPLRDTVACIEDLCDEANLMEREYFRLKDKNRELSDRICTLDRKINK